MRTVRYKKEDLKIIADRLLKGDIIAFPTDTVFGLACVYDSEKAKNKIFKAKGRDEKKALPMMCVPEHIEDVAYINETEKRIIDKFMPGAITVIFKKRDLPDYVTNGLDTVGIRVPDDRWILELIREVGKPLLVTSANRSDEGSLIKYEDVLSQMDGRINGIVTEDARGEAASTIVTAYDELKVLREGPISYAEIKEAVYG